MTAPTRTQILVIEDDVQVSDALSKRLSHAGFDVTATASGHDAVQRAHTWRPALITLDVLLPDIDGREVAMQLSRDPETAKIPVIFITGTANRHITESCGTGGNRFFLRKPYDPALLVQLIRSLLARDEQGGEQRGRKSKRQRLTYRVKPRGDKPLSCPAPTHLEQECRP